MKENEKKKTKETKKIETTDNTKSYVAIFSNRISQ